MTYFIGLYAVPLLASAILAFVFYDMRSLREGAGVAGSLAARVNRHITSDTHIFVVGGDGAPMTLKHYRKGRKALLKWLKKGCQIDYLLTLPVDDLAGMGDLAREYPKQLRIYDVNREDVERADIREDLELLREVFNDTFRTVRFSKANLDRRTASRRRKSSKKLRVRLSISRRNGWSLR